MKFLILRKKRFFKKQKDEKILLKDFEVEIVYVLKVGRKIRRMAEKFDGVFSLDFKEFFKKERLLFLFASEALEKIRSRHGGTDRETLEVWVDILNEENVDALTDLALNSRYVILHSHTEADKFDFLCTSAGVCPQFSTGEFVQNIVVFMGEEFLIKHLPSGKVYYDILPALPEDFYEYFLPEGNMIFSEYIKANPEIKANVKIRELMSK